MLIVDGSIVIVGGFTYGWNNMLYALIVLYLLSFMTDRIMLGISKSKAFYIITGIVFCHIGFSSVCTPLI